MIYLTLNKEKTHYLFITFLILTYWINRKAFLFLRYVDIVFIFYAIYMLISKQYKIRLLKDYIIFFFLSILISTFIGMLVRSVAIEGVAFFYKYGLIFILIWILDSIEISEENIKKLINLLFLSYFFLVLFVIFRTALVAGRIITARGGIRPDFPFTTHELSLVNAGHLFGTFLSTGLVAVIFHKINVKAFYKALIVILSFGAVILTGSRGPILSLILTLLVWSYQTVKDKFAISDLHKAKKNIIRGILIIVIVLIIVVPNLTLFFKNYQASKIMERIFNRTVERIINYEFGSDEAIENRLLKIQMGIENLLSSGFLFGVGPLSFPSWFDNGIIRIANDGGLLGLLAFSLLIYNFFKRIDRKKEGALYYSLVAFIIGNISAEFFLVSRVAIPFVIMIMLLKKEYKVQIKTKKKFNYDGIYYNSCL